MRKKDVEFHAKAIKDGIFSACWIITVNINNLISYRKHLKWPLKDK